MEKRSLNRSLVLLNLINLVLLCVLLLAGVPTQMVLLAMLLSTLAVVVFTILSFSRSLGQISEITRKVSSGERNIRIPELDVQEFDSMGKSINRMLGSLDSTIGHLAVHREELRLLLGSLEEVLWSQDSEGLIMWANEAFANLFPGYRQGMKQYFWELIREPELKDYIEQSLRQEGRILKEFCLDEHYYLLIGTRNREANRLILVMQNIDPIRQAEQMKRDFIVNLAHELRTSLTAIKGFAETLLDDQDEERSRYIKIIHRHSLRLVNLIQDLETLIRLERQLDINLREIDLKLFLDNLRLILQPLLDEAGLYLHISLGPGLERVLLDPFRFEQVLINLVENSVRFTEQGGVDITAQSSGRNLSLKICDTGSGIPEQHLSRIFERFYVVDPSRNRGKSGTGLGLSIVKHIVLLHNGSINVTSEMGKGTCFQITLPDCVLPAEGAKSEMADPTKGI